MALNSGIRIEGLFLGNSFELTRSVVGIPAGQTIDLGELYIEEDSSDDNSNALVFIPITIIDDPQFGQITDDGAGDGEGNVLFRIASESTFAEIVIDPAGVDNAVKFTAVTVGQLGNNISVEYLDPGAALAPLTVTVTDQLISISLATDGGSLITSTAADIIALVNVDVDASALVVAAPSGADTGVVTAITETFLERGNTGTTDLDANKDYPYLMQIYLENGNLHLAEVGVMRFLDPDEPAPPITASSSRARAANTGSERTDNIINNFVDVLLRDFRQLRVWDEHVRRSGNDPFTLFACYRNWNPGFFPEVWDAQNDPINSSQIVADFNNATVRVSNDDGNEDYFVTYEFDLFPVQDLLNMLGITLQEMNIGGAADGGHITDFATVDDAPTYWDGLLALGVVAKAFQRLAVDSGLWKNYLIWVDGERGQQLAKDASDYYTARWDSLIVSLKRVHLLAQPTEAFAQFRSIGFGFFALEGGKFRGLEVNKLTTF